MTTETTWQDISLHDPSSLLQGDISTDVVVIGGGIAGATTAYLLAKAGKKVVIVDKAHSIKDSVTAYTTAFLTRSVDTDFSDLRKRYGEENTNRILQSHEDAIDLVEQIIRDERISCDFVRVPNYSIALSSSGAHVLQKECDISKELGFSAAMKEASFFPFKNYGAMVTERQALFHPLKYLQGVLDAFQRLGGEYYTDTEAIAIEGSSPVFVRTLHGTVTAQAVVTATYNPFVQPWWFIFKKGMYKSYVYEITAPHHAIPEGMYEDDNNPYCYFRVEGTRIIIGGEDHRIELKLNPEKSFNALKDYIEHDLGISDYSIIRRWTGPILEQTDGAPLIGRYDARHPNRYVATAFSGNGMTNGTIAAQVVTDLIVGKENSYAKLYNPRRMIRFSDIILKGRDYLVELFNGVRDNLSH
jgi:glycine/D-amino acid oxidase-like deaminating enzyme